MRELYKISTFIEKKQFNDLKVLSGITRVKVADYIREGIDMVLARYQKELKKSQKKGGD
jgi:hypothetical protein